MAPHANANEPMHDPMLVDDATLYEDVEDLTPTVPRPTSAASRRASRTPSNTSSTNRRRRSSTGGNGAGVPAANGVGSAPSSKRNSKQLVQSTRRQPFLALGYELHETLGEGEFGKVKLAIHSATRTKVAIKVFKRSRLDDDEKRLKLQREIDILHSVVHQSIVRLFDVVETDDLIGLVIEYASGGELFDYILANRCLPEDEARRLFAQLVEGVHYMHSKNVVHRDLKLENLLLSSTKDLVIIDFGFANQFPPPGSPEHLATHHRASVASSIISTWGGSADRALHVPDRHFLMATSCGSPCYAAPELVIADGYVGTSADVWSCGVILFAMLAGYLPFDDDPENPQGDNITLLYRYILSEPTPLHFPPEMGDEAKDLIARILVPDPERRLTMVEVIEHPWLAPYRAVLDVDYEAPPRVPEKDANAVAAAAAAQSAPAVPRASLLATAAANRASALYVPAAASAETVLAPAAESGLGSALSRPTSAVGSRPTSVLAPGSRPTSVIAPSTVIAPPAVVALPAQPSSVPPTPTSPVPWISSHANSPRASVIEAPPAPQPQVQTQLLPPPPPPKNADIEIRPLPALPPASPTTLPPAVQAHLASPRGSAASAVSSSAANAAKRGFVGRIKAGLAKLKRRDSSAAASGAGDSDSDVGSPAGGKGKSKPRPVSDGAGLLAVFGRMRKDEYEVFTKTDVRAQDVAALTTPSTPMSPASSSAVPVAGTADRRARTKSTSAATPAPAGTSLFEQIRRKSVSLYEEPVFEKTEVPPLPPLPVAANMTHAPYVSVYADRVGSPAPGSSPRVPPAVETATPPPVPAKNKGPSLTDKMLAKLRNATSDTPNAATTSSNSAPPPLSAAFFDDVVPRLVSEELARTLGPESFTTRSPEVVLFEARKVLEGLGAIVVAYDRDPATGAPGHGEGRFKLKCRVRLGKRGLTNARLKAELETLALLENDPNALADLGATTTTAWPVVPPSSADNVIRSPSVSHASPVMPRRKLSSASSWADSLSVYSAFSAAAPASAGHLPEDYPSLYAQPDVAAALAAGRAGPAAAAAVAAAQANGAAPPTPVLARSNTGVSAATTSAASATGEWSEAAAVVPAPPAVPPTRAVEHVLLTRAPHAAAAANAMYRHPADGANAPVSLHYSSYYSATPTMSAATRATSGAEPDAVVTPKRPKSITAATPVLRKIRSIAFGSDLLFTLEVCTLPQVRGVVGLVMQRTKGSSVSYGRVKQVVLRKLQRSDDKIRALLGES
ncbi:hypothetical protein GGF31_007631 [Allomyces arbusculus]|nr:hypothetical protein GGF31_007631 [Allomyces arbusculus]